MVQVIQISLTRQEAKADIGDKVIKGELYREREMIILRETEQGAVEEVIVKRYKVLERDGTRLELEDITQ